MKLISLLFCVLFAMVYGIPAPQSPEEADRPQRPIINAINTAVNVVNNAYAQANNMAQTTLGTLSNSGITAAENFASSASEFINRTAHTMTNRINSIAETWSGNINNISFRPAESPSGSPERLYPDLQQAEQIFM